MRIFINVRNSIRKILREEYKIVPKVGDFLYCHTDVVMDDDDINARVGKKYEIIDIDNRGLTIFNDFHQHHRFTLEKEDDANYENWFTLIPPDIQGIDFFGQLYESVSECPNFQKIVIFFDKEVTNGELKFIVNMLEECGAVSEWDDNDYASMMKYISESTSSSIPYVRVDEEDNQIYYGSNMMGNNVLKFKEKKSYLEFLVNSDDIFNQLQESEEFEWVKDLGKPKRILFKDLKVGMTVMVDGLFDRWLQFNKNIGRVYKDTSHSGYDNIFIVFDDWHRGHNDQHKIHGDRTPNPGCKTNNCYYFDNGDGLKFYTIR